MMRFVALVFVMLVSTFAVDRLSAAPQQGDALKAFAVGPLARLDFSHKGTAAPDIAFESKQGPAKLSDFKGKVVVLNLWATWCGPCVHELPTLDILAFTSNPKDVAVLTVSQDLGGWKAIDAFWGAGKFPGLKPYSDKKGQFGAFFKAGSLPYTVIYDRKGREVARFDRGNDWSSPQVEALLNAVGAIK